MKLKSIIYLLIIFTNPIIYSQQSTTIEYTGKTPEGLVGNGKSVVRVLPSGFAFHTGGDASGSFELFVDDKTYELKSTISHSEFFPGGVIYNLKIADMDINILHGASEVNDYIVAVQAKGKSKNVKLNLLQKGNPQLTPSGLISIPMKNGIGEIILYTGTSTPKEKYSELRKQWETQYQKGFVLTTPSTLINRAVPFNRYLLNLGFNGQLHVCEIFRWRDVWSRDLGSGLVPGALSAGQYSTARTTIEYDLNRYATHNPKGLKVTEDPSQGGSAEGTAWLTRAVWKYYLLTGDKQFLSRAENILLPWVTAWIDRDYRKEGLLIDVTEWMDHSRFFLFPDGSRILYSNVLFAGLLETFSKIEIELGKNKIANDLQLTRDRFISGINKVLWNESTGEYDNLNLWGKRDERSSSAENALAILCGVAPQDRIERILNNVRKNNWRTAGSTTIFPPMTHVDVTIDHNYKMWPWWNAVEARTRFLNGDISGGIHLLECCSKTLEDEHFPGLMEELTSPDGVTEGGNAFLTAAGSYQDAIVEGLLGIEILEPGCKRIRISPNVPADWKDWDAAVPLPEGEIIFKQKDGKLTINITDKRVNIIEAPNSISIVGAERKDISQREYPDLTSLPKNNPVEYPELKNRKAAVFFDSSFSSKLPDGLPKKYFSADDLLYLDTTSVTALIIPGNALPIKTSSGKEIKPTLSKFLEKGNAIVFYDATMLDRGTMGETGGVIDWYDYRPTILYKPMNGWKFKTNRDDYHITHENESGLAKGWNKQELNDRDWESINVPQLWETHMNEAYDGWGWYRIHLNLSKEDKGKTILLDLGEIDDADWTYVNGVFVGSENGWQRFRRYELKSSDSVYAKLNFGGDNVIAIQVFDGGGGGGLYIDSTKIGIETDLYSWIPIQPRTGISLFKPERFGVVSWGPGGDFFNSWETSRGAFGFKISGNKIEFAEPLSDLPSIDCEVHEAFTDFAISAPLVFQPLAFTTTNRKLLIPDNGERYPCMARIVNTQTGGEFILIPASLTKTSEGIEVLKKLKIE